jgi:hypothetical protein
MKHLLYILTSLLMCAAVMAEPATSDPQLKAFEERLTKLEQEGPYTSASVKMLERRLRDNGALGAAAFLAGCFCALWAQNTGRGAWRWFFFGFFLAPFALIILLTNNSTDSTRARARRLGSR